LYSYSILFNKNKAQAFIIMTKEETKIKITDDTDSAKQEPDTDRENTLGDGSPNESRTDDPESGSIPKTDQKPGDGSKPENDQDSESNGDEDELQVARKEAKDAYDRFLRVSAEFDNYKKRAAREAAEFKKFANETLVKEILPILDNLERAIELSDTQNGLVEGVEMTLKEMLKVFEKFNVTPIDAVGEPFDPCFHQAVIQEESDSHPENTVIKELQKGYLMHERLIRPAMVVVSSSASGNGPSADGSCEG
jgi:molecular chaperone GrpE